ncbi:MAG: BPL-N domain-containing protein [Polyangiales bacterium]
MLPTIAVYHDDGAGPFSRACLVFALAEAFRGRATVRRIRAAEIVASDDWHAGTLLLAFPGGADRPYCAKLDGAGNASIRRYIEAGGALLGVCAGAYYAATRIAWEANRPDEITGQRELALFAGTARGSLHDLAEPYALEHLRCAAVAQLRAAATGEQLAALYWGGPEFLPDAGAVYKPLAYYAGSERLAALRTDVGRGRVVLTGVHAEITGSQLPIEVSAYSDESFEHGMRVSAELTQLDPARRRLFDLLIAELS